MTAPAAGHDPIPVAEGDFAAPPMDATVTRYLIPWDWWDAVGIYLAWLVVSSAGAFAVLGLLGEGDDALAGQIVVSLVLLTVVTVAWVHLRGAAAGVTDAVRRSLGVKQPALRDVALGVGYGLAGFLVVQLGLGGLLTTVIQEMGEEVPQVQEQVQQAVRGAGRSTLLIAFGVAVLAPLGEELLFRGVLYQGLAKHLGGWPSIGLSGLAFGLTHVEPLVIVLTFPLGMLLAWTMRRHGTLVVPIVAHAVFNLIGVLLIRSAPPVV
jgi:uncharacterized protein